MKLTAAFSASQLVAIPLVIAGPIILSVGKPTVTVTETMTMTVQPEQTLQVLQTQVGGDRTMNGTFSWPTVTQAVAVEAVAEETGTPQDPVKGPDDGKVGSGLVIGLVAAFLGVPLLGIMYFAYKRRRYRV
ncbi:hypothetical protein M011DRAFT_467285 [Sporormia fimetaria CBS 119925]|uniref:Mid2 domain-containing protein n=1 Tax=Sporormia fimetaria CBS 119925 TaxID=1340428 RepID=A0A6A6VAP2_9PLEO|nr:hypothetical protein M011DRAFT_467285 [Sporormia fimetaria CBS 119925]